MKIAYCITRMDEIGGAQIHLRDIALAFQKQGHDISILSGSLGDLTDHLAGSGIKIYHVPSLKRSIHPYYDVLALFQISKLLFKIKPDVVACHSSKAGLLGRLAAKICGIKSVFTAHGWAFTEGVSPNTAKIYRVLEKWASKITTHIITVSQYDRDLALKYKIAPPEKMTVIHNGVPDILYEGRMISEDHKPLKLLMVARFGGQKDHKLLLSALKNCRDLDWTLDLVGRGDAQEFIEYCIENNIQDRVNFLGERNDVADLLKDTDVFLLISRWEGLPISILEAMRASVPVIASDVGGVKESVIDGQTGYLVPRGDAKVLEQRLRTLMNNKSDAIMLGANGRRVYEKNFSFQSMIQSTFNVYSLR